MMQLHVTLSEKHAAIVERACAQFGVTRKQVVAFALDEVARRIAEYDALEGARRSGNPHG